MPKRERCRADARLIRGEAVQSKNLFANQAQGCFPSSLDRVLEWA
jgi:hypothetical protein